MKKNTGAGAVALLCLCMICFLISTSHAAVRFYGGTASGGIHEYDLVEIDPSTGQTTLVVDGRLWTGMDFTPDGRTLFGVSNRLYTIDITAGTYAEIGPLTLQGSDPVLMVSMTIAPDGRMYAMGESYIDPSSPELFLYRIDKATGNLEHLGTPQGFVWALEFAPDGTLYGAEFDLMTLDPADGSILQTIGQLDTSLRINELDAAEDGTLHGTDHDGGLYRINTATGEATFLTSYGGGDDVWSLVTKSRSTLDITVTNDTPPVIEWQSHVGETYYVSVSDDLLTWITASGALPASGTGVNSWADDGLHRLGPASAARLRYYRVQLP